MATRLIEGKILTVPHTCGSLWTGRVSTNTSASIGQVIGIFKKVLTVSRKARTLPV